MRMYRGMFRSLGRAQRGGPPRRAIAVAGEGPAVPAPAAAAQRLSALPWQRWLVWSASGVVLALALGLRLYHLNYFVPNTDEAIYQQALLLMQRGYLPFRDFFFAQGPLFLPLLYPFSLLGGIVG